MDITKNGYAEYVVVELGLTKMVIISGQLSLDEKGKVIGQNDFEKQVDQIFLRLSAILHVQGGCMHHIVKLNSYLTEIKNLPLLKKVRDKYVNIQNPPASTTVEIKGLFRPEFLIEVEATAIIPIN